MGRALYQSAAAGARGAARDGIRAGLVTLEQLLNVPLFRIYHAEVLEKYPNLAGRRLVYEVLRRMINHLVSDLINSSAERLSSSGVRSIAEVRAHAKPLIGFSDATRELNYGLKVFLREELYKHYKAGIVQCLFQRSDPDARRT